MAKNTGKTPMVNVQTLRTANQTPEGVQPRDDLQDWPDWSRPAQSPGGNPVCEKCGALYENQHWVMDERRSRTLVSAGVANMILCPACRQIEQHLPQGIVTLRGDYWPEHREDILNLIRNEETRAMGTNPLERIMDIRDEGESLVVETTNEKLAQKIGRAIHSAHKGDLEYKWPDGNQLVRVEWRRPLSNGSHK